MRPHVLQACLRAGIESRATQVGPFLVLINSHHDGWFHNYAVPVDGAAPTGADAQALVEFFAAHHRRPRLEYVRPAPAVDAALREAGFTVDATLTLMAVDEPVPPPATPDYRVLLPTDDEHLSQAVLVQDTAYGEPTDQTPDPAGLRSTVRDGGCVALVVHAGTGEPAGAGLFTLPKFGLVEVAGIGVLPEHRRRGVAALVASALTEEALRRGHRPFLQVEKDEPARVYARIGYRVIGEMADARRAVSVDRPTPTVDTGERDTLLAFLDYSRAGLVGKLAGVGDAQARRSVLPSGTTLLWLVKHTMAVELFWLHHAFGGAPKTDLMDDELTDEDSPASVIERYRQVAKATTELVTAHPDLDVPGAVALFEPPAWSLHWTLVHLVEEVSRHAGHADILREQIDGVTGR
jgi:GNAT superfamily N-acetyltransferase